MKKITAMFVLVLAIVILPGCPEDPPPPQKHDPDAGEQTKGQTIDLEVINGTITHMWVDWFTGDNNTAEKKGQPYHCITVLMKDEKGNNKEETFKGIPVDKFKLIRIGLALPLIDEFKEDDYGKIEGKVVDYWASPEENKFMIVIRTDSGFRVCKASEGLYYNKIKKTP